MKTKRTQQFLADNGVTMLIADMTENSPEIESLLHELGNAAAAIPFYAIYPGDGRDPIRFNDVPLLQAALLQKLESAVGRESNVATREDVMVTPQM